MPKIQWEHLPREKWAHLRDRAKERQISQEDLFSLAEWNAEDPDVPDGDWYKDFGAFKLSASEMRRVKHYDARKTFKVRDIEG
jgi:hypothetical protein